MFFVPGVAFHDVALATDTINEAAGFPVLLRSAINMAVKEQI
jgi:hypothetical protein